MFSQGDLNFSYDASGNQIFRGPSTNKISSKLADSTIVSTDLKEEKEPTSIELAESEENIIEISASPNPVRDVLFVKWENNEEQYFQRMDLFNYQYQLLKQVELTANQQNQNVSLGRFPQGIYILVFTTNLNKTQSYKIIKK
jgi:hypothetical protein